MFRSLTSFIFGSNTSATVNNEDQQQQPEQQQQQQQLDPLQRVEDVVDSEDAIRVEWCASSVTGAAGAENLTKRRGRNRRNNKSNKKAREQQPPPLKKQQQQQPSLKKQQQQQPSLKKQQQLRQESKEATKLVATTNDFEEDLNEDDDWLIVEKEDEDDCRPDHSDLEEELALVEVKSTPLIPLPTPPPTPPSGSTAAATAAAATPRRARQQLGSHSQYTGSRAPQERNHLQRARNHSERVLSISRSSPSRSVAAAENDRERDAVAGGPAAAEDVVCIGGGVGGDDGSMTKSLYATQPLAAGSGNDTGNGSGPAGMEESWFVTPPPCFTSIGPINMETSPLENLLIEHPSMSVYSSIRLELTAYLDLLLTQSQKRKEQRMQKRQLRQQQQQQEQQQQLLAAAEKMLQRKKRRQQQLQEKAEKKTALARLRGSAARVDAYSAAQVKQELLARSNQKTYDKQQRRLAACRGAIQRSNKTREYQGKSSPQRRSDLQHFRCVSGANNNRKC